MEVWNYGMMNNVNHLDSEISYANKNVYNGDNILSGNGIDGNKLWIGIVRDNHMGRSNFAFYSTYLFDRSLDEQEIKAFIRKYIDPEYLLPSENSYS
jgi:hypothetical protein